jgi:hypothetical protein
LRPFWIEKRQKLYPLVGILGQGDWQRLPTDRVAYAGEQPQAGLPDLHESRDRESRRLPETRIPDDAGWTITFKEAWREHSKLCDQQPDTKGGRQDESGGMKVQRNRLRRPQVHVWSQ